MRMILNSIAALMVFAALSVGSLQAQTCCPDNCCKGHCCQKKA